MNVIVCIKRVPDTGGGFRLGADGKHLDVTNLEFTISPHEECAVEEGIRIVEKHGGRSTALTLGPAQGQDQLREALAKGIQAAILLEAADYEDWDSRSTAQAIAEAVRGMPCDVLLFGNESADSSCYQVAVRVAEALDIPCLSGVKALELDPDAKRALAKREVPGGWEVYEVPLPAAFSVKEGINTPRHPSLRGIMQAKKIQIEKQAPQKASPQIARLALRKPAERSGQVEILGQGLDGVPRLAAKLREMGAI